ncbi:MAG: RNA methyltransferase, partial [Flavobacteriaceae bacterium]|nr:RNA methyltransferase [Flavobacteriaceae bacterium]
MSKHISSIQNPTIKKLIQLQEKSRTRRKERLFITEGVREIRLASKGQYIIQTLFYCSELIDSEEKKEMITSY